MERLSTRSRLVLTAVVATLWLGPPSAAPAADLAVPGTFPSIQAALDAASPGDRIVVSPGVYAERLDFRGKDVLLESASGPEETVLEPTGARGVVIGPAGGLTGFTLRPVAVTTFAVLVRGAGPRLQGNAFDGTLAGTPRAFVWILSGTPLLDGNRFAGFQCNDDPAAGVVSVTSIASATLVNNVFEGNACPGVNLGVASASVHAQNNTFVGNAVALRVDARSASARFANNLVFANGLGLELLFPSEAQGFVWQHNLVFGNALDASADPDPAGTGGNLSLEPMLVDPDAGDYRLLVGSPAIDAGMAEDAPPHDIDGAPRPSDGDGDGVAAVDIGAYEAATPAAALDVRIDIRPGSARNALNPWSPGIVAVVLLGGDGVDVLAVDPASLAFGPAGAPLAFRRAAHRLDVDGDGALDLLAHFRIQRTGIRRGDREACLVGLLGGVPFEGCDAVRVVPRRPLFCWPRHWRAAKQAPH